MTNSYPTVVLGNCVPPMESTLTAYTKVTGSPGPTFEIAVSR